MSEGTSKNLTKCVVSVSMIVLIGLSVYHTKEPECLWALFFPFWVLIEW
jgi:hypothetical protein